MRILIAIDKFKGTFSALEIAQIMAKNLENLGHQTTILPMSDGGEGFLEAIENVKSLNVQRIPSSTFDPLMWPMKAYFLYDNRNKIAYIELAKTGSLNLLAETERNPLWTTSYGLGQQIAQALDLGAKTIYTGLGGSSTTDCGIGMAQALGYKFYNSRGQDLHGIGKNLPYVHKIVKHALPENVHFIGCADVKNPLYGPNGAAFVYSAQKGASPGEIEYLDRGLRHIAKIVDEQLGVKIGNFPGDGAAGGLGAGIRAFLKGTLTSGAKFIADLNGLDQQIVRNDLVITGEGKFDSQSSEGKVVWEVIDRAKKANKPVIVIAGQCGDYAKQANVRVFCLFGQNISIEQAHEQTEAKIREVFKRIFI